MPKMVDRERRLEAVHRISSASHYLRSRIAYESPQRGSALGRIVARKIPHRLERGEVQGHRFDFGVPRVRDEPLHSVAAFFDVPTSDDYAAFAGLGKRSRALKTQAGIGARDDDGVHVRG